MIEAAVRFCKGFAKDVRNGRTLVFCGNNGVGKTHCLKRIAAWAQHIAPSRQFVARKNHIRTPEVSFTHWPTLLDEMKSGQWRAIDVLEQVELLALDEIGGAHDPSKVGADKLCRLLSHREGKWTVITSNLMPEAWEEQFDRRIASRLGRGSEIVQLDDAPDYGIQKGQP